MNLNINEEWLRKMAESEPACGPSVGGLAVEMGLYRKPLPPLEELTALDLVDWLVANQGMIQVRRGEENTEFDYITIAALKGEGIATDTRVVSRVMAKQCRANLHHAEFARVLAGVDEVLRYEQPPLPQTIPAEVSE